MSFDKLVVKDAVEVIRAINGSNAMTVAYFNTLTKSCADKLQ